MKAQPLFPKFIVALSAFSSFYAHAETIVVTSDTLASALDFEATDDLVIESGATFTVDDAFDANSISIYGGTLVVESGNTVTVDDGVEIDYDGSFTITDAVFNADIFSYDADILNIAASSEVNGSVHLGGANEVNIDGTTFSEGVVISGGLGPVSFTNNIITDGGLFAIYVGDFMISGNTIDGDGDLRVDDSGEGTLDGNTLAEGNSIVLIENDGVDVMGTISSGVDTGILVSATSGDVNVTDNTVDTLSVLDNGATTVSGNSVTDLEILGGEGECTFDENTVLGETDVTDCEEPEEPEEEEELPEFVEEFVTELEGLDVTPEEIEGLVDLILGLLELGVTEETAEAVIDDIIADLTPEP